MPQDRNRPVAEAVNALLGSVVVNRAMMTAIGAGAGLALYGLLELNEADVLTGRLFLMLVAACASFFTGVMAMTGPLGLGRALMGAVAIALSVTALLGIASLSYVNVEQMGHTPYVLFAAIALSTVPMPFWIAANRAGWRDYPALFTQSWSIVVRYSAGWAFTGLIWAVVLLSDALLTLVGITVIGDLLNYDAVPFLVTGMGLGLGMAVVQEYSDFVSPYLILRLLRLLLPVVLLVSVVFLIALPFRGFSGLLGNLSFAFTILAMVGAAASLVTTAVDQTDDEAAQSPAMQFMTQAMAVLLPVMAFLGAWAIWQRVAQYGWTPSRVIAAQIAFLGLGYGISYATAILRRKNWREDIRQANIFMAIAVVVMAALTLTPLLNAERIATNSVMARLADGRLAVEDLQPNLLENWGTAGQAAHETLAARAKEPGQEALAARLADPYSNGNYVNPSRDALLAEIKSIMPLQPEHATATRDIYLEGLNEWRLPIIAESCRQKLAGGGPGCVMVVADLLPRSPGEEAIVVDYITDGYLNLTGLRMDGVDGPQSYEVHMSGERPQGAEAEALIEAWQAAPPAAVALPINQLTLPNGAGLMLLP